MLIHSPASACPPDRAQNVTLSVLSDSGDVLLADGRTLRLANLDWPMRDARGERRELVAEISAMLASKVMLAEISGGQDRWGRWPAHVFVAPDQTTAPLWLQGTLLEDGKARAWPSRTPDGCWPAARSAEQKARAGMRGIWAGTPMAAGQAGDPVPQEDSAMPRRQVYEGIVRSVRRGRSVTFVNFAGARDLTPSLMMPQALVNEFRKVGRDPATFVGKRLRVWAEREPGSRPRLSVAGPHMVEIVE